MPGCCVVGALLFKVLFGVPTVWQLLVLDWRCSQGAQALDAIWGLCWCN